LDLSEEIYSRRIHEKVEGFNNPICDEFRIPELWNLEISLNERGQLWKSDLKYQCLNCGRIVSAQLPHLHKNKELGYCENFSKQNFSNFSDGPLID